MTVKHVTPRNHPNLWLSPDAAASLNRLEAGTAVIRIKSAGRTVEEQQHLIDLWNKGGPANRPPYLYKPAMPAKSSNHIDGDALDTSSSIMKTVGATYGWFRNYSYDVVHWEYDKKRDTALHALSHPSAGQATRRPTIKAGARGEQVKALQTILAHYHDFTGRPDGVFGRETTAAVVRFQRSAKLTADGIVGPATWAALGQ